MPANGKPNGRFTLPALTPVSFSLTDGTDIPPPPDSPIQEKAPEPTPSPVAHPADSAPAAAPFNGNAAPSANGVYDGRGRTTTTVDRPPLSPASTTRPSSIRRFLSRRSLNTNYTNGNHDNGSQEDILGGGRPDSPTSFLSGRPTLGKKRSGSWFTKLGGGGKRTSVVYENGPVQQAVQQEKKGPPPPKLPELNQLKAKIADDDEGSLGGGEMFRNIRGE